MLSKIRLWHVVLLVAAVVIAALVVLRVKNRALWIEGVILTQDTDPRRQAAISGAEVTATIDGRAITTSSDQTGAFRLKLPGGYWRGLDVPFQFRRAGYQNLNVTPPLDRLLVVRLVRAKPGPLENQGQETTLTDVRVRYVVQATTPINVGSLAKTFEVVNVGNIPCDRHTGPCSPDGKWKAASGGMRLDAGSGHEFENIRTTCIAGPCPFTKVESNLGSLGGQIVNVSVLDWSDTATFLVEADVMQTLSTNVIRNDYPAIFGREMSFTLPASTQGVSIEATSNGTDVVYPLGPSLTMSWAACTLQVGADHSKLYRCALKQGYRF